MEFVWRTVGAVAVVGILLAALAWARRRGWVTLAGRPAGRRLEALERLALGPQHTLHLVRLGDEALLVACSPSGCAVLERLPRAPASQLPVEARP